MKHRLLLSAILPLAFASWGCARSSGNEPVADPAPPASAAAPPRATAPASASAAPAPTSFRWAGTYTAAPGSFYVYDGGEWKGVHFRGDDASVALGDGVLSLVVEPRSNVVRGKASGALGEAVITGAVTGDELSFSLLRADPMDRGLTGTGVGKVTGDTVSGTMHLSRGDAHVIREARFSLSKAVP